MTAARLKRKQGFTTFSLHERGFTLVELLVVISIIAVLSVIGMAVFTGVSKSGRDAKRREDVDAIAKALETTKVNSLYRPLTDSDFASGAKPKDPTYKSCSLGGFVSTNGGCAEVISNVTYGYIVCGAGTNPPNDSLGSGICSLLPAPDFYICTRLENNSGGNYSDMWFTSPTANGGTYCRRNQQ